MTYEDMTNEESNTIQPLLGREICGARLKHGVLTMHLDNGHKLEVAVTGGGDLEFVTVTPPRPAPRLKREAFHIYVRRWVGEEANFYVRADTLEEAINIGEEMVRFDAREINWMDAADIKDAEVASIENEAGDTVYDIDD